MSDEDYFWDAEIDELTQGYFYHETNDEYVCLLCNERFENGVIFPIEGKLYDARKTVRHHIQRAHTSVFDYLLQMDKKYTGITAHQKELLHYFEKGLTDKEIVAEMNGGSASTIRTHRFKLKEKEKQAKVFLALMTLLENKKENKKSADFIDFHKGATMIDERYAITEEEKEKVLSTYFKEGLDGKIDTFPSKEKRKLIVLQNIIRRFEPNQTYSEKEVNEILKTVYADFVTIRRYLIEYGFMDRTPEGTAYWIK